MLRTSDSPTKVRETKRQLEPPEVLRALTAEADVRFNGDRPWDIQIHDANVYSRILKQGSLGLGETYMEGLWDSQQLDELFSRLLSADINDKMHGLLRVRWLAGTLNNRLRNMLINRQSRHRAFRIGEHHYDTGNQIFEAMLDSTMSYSCGYWQNANNLEQAQRAKLDLICRKLELQPGERLLDIGCGWGGLLRHAVEHYGIEALGITVSQEQQRLARERCHGLPVNIELMDYRDLQGRFDKVVSVGMFEHVGLKNYRTFFQTVLRVLEGDGLFLLHTIGDFSTNNMTDPWIDKHIFPNYKLPSPKQLTAALEPDFLLQDWQNFGPDYETTLMAWRENFNAAWPDLRGGRYDERFYRMWNYYLQLSIGFFRSRQGQLWQIVLSKRGRRAVYRWVR